GLPLSQTVMQLIVDPNNPTRFYATVPADYARGGFGAQQTTAQGIFVSSDGQGAVWTQINNGLGNVSTAGAIDITAHGGGGTVAYAGASFPNPTQPRGHATVYRSIDGGANWVPLANTPADLNAEFFVNQLFNMVADPVTNDVVYVSGHGGGNNIFRYDPAITN